jgi:uncharacterized protein involved in response to NO
LVVATLAVATFHLLDKPTESAMVVHYSKYVFVGLLVTGLALAMVQLLNRQATLVMIVLGGMAIALCTMNLKPSLLNTTNGKSVDMRQYLM